MSLTEDQQKKYVSSGGVRCPYCGSDDIEGGFVEINAGGAEQELVCNACQKKWRNVYQLVHIEEVQNAEA